MIARLFERLPIYGLLPFHVLKGNWTDGCVMLFNVQHYIEADFVHYSERSVMRTEDALKESVDDLRRTRGVA